MTDTYDFTLVLASYLVAVIASFAAIYFSNRARSTQTGVKSFTYAAGVLCLGGGIWTMHFVGMSAYHTNFDMTFDFTWTLFSLVAVLIASALGLWVITLEKVTMLQLAVSAFFMGMGVFTMHYSGMIAMKMSPGIIYNIPLVILSGVIAVVASFAALVICRNIEHVPVRYNLFARLSAALVMGFAVCSMHYSGMSAVTFLVDSICSADNSLRGNWMGIPTAIVASAFLILLIYIGFEDYRAAERAKQKKADQDEAVMKFAFLDAVSGLPNRTSLDKHLEVLLNGKNGQPTKPFDLFYIELSDYRSLLQSEGEAVTQKYATEFARNIQQCLPKGTYLARYNTNGFVAIMPDTGLATLEQSAKILSDQLSRSSGGKLANLPVRFGLGYSHYPQSGTLARMLIRQAQVIKLRQEPKLKSGLMNGLA